MADYDSQLPVRSEGDGADEKVHVKLVGHGSTNAVGDLAQNQQVVDSEGNAHTQIMGDRADDQTEVALRLSELGNANTDGDYHVDDNSKPSSTALIIHDRNITPGETHQNFRPTGVQSTVDAAGDPETTTHAMDVAIRDEAGNPYSLTNPLPVSVEPSEGAEVHDFDQAVAIAKDNTSNHDYSVADGVKFEISDIWASASGKMKVEVQVGDGAASEAFTTKWVAFNSTATPNIQIRVREFLEVIGTVNTTTIRIIKTNLDNQSQDLYSTLVGVEE